jgi:O-antigen/teichoic acid export membrane protein
VTVLLPEASRKRTNAAVTILARASLLSTAVTGIAALGLAVVAPMLLALLYGEAFAPAIGPFRILLVDAVLTGFGWIMVQAFLSLNRPGIVTITNLLGLLVSVPCMLFLVPVFGISGAALAVLASSIVRLIFVLCCFPLVLKVRGRDLLQIRAWELLLPRRPAAR